MNEEYLFQAEAESSKLYVCCIPKRELKTYELPFTFSWGMGFYHVDGSFYVGGGTLDDDQYFSEFRKVAPDGQFSELHKMPTSKAYFAMTLWRQRSTLFTLGGSNPSYLK